MQKGIAVLKSWGFDVIYDPHIIDPQVFLANTDHYRFEQFKKAMLNPKTHAVWCLRGGYGSMRLLPMINKMPVPQQPKLLIGLSDITSLQTILTQKWKWPSLHTSMVDRFGMNRVSESNIEEIKKTLTDENFSMTFPQLQPLNEAARQKKVIKGTVTGGNLMVATATLGTQAHLKTKGKIIFLEELAERAYRIDRCLQQMKQAGVFDEAGALVFGDFTQCHEPNGDDYVQYTLEQFSRGLKIPVFRGLQNGHGELQRPLFFNTPAVLNCGDRSLVVQSAFRKGR